MKPTSKLGNLGLTNLNGELLCAIDSETTGLDAGFHDIIELAIVPLDAQFRQIKEVDGQPLFPFDVMIKMKRPQNVTKEAMTINKIDLADLEINGLEPYRAAELFDRWFENLQLVAGKKLVPLAKNWAFDAGFIKDLLGPETFKARFSHRARELTAALYFFNDRAEFQGGKAPFTRIDLGSVCSVLGIEFTRAHRAVDDALATAECYRRLMHEYIK